MKLTLARALAPLALTLLAACGDDPRTTDIVNLNRDAAAGKVVYDANCSGCHGATGAGTAAGPDLSKQGRLSDETIVNTILSGKGSMPAYADKLSDQEVADALGYVRQLQGK